MFTYRLITQGQLVFDAVEDRSRVANTTSLSQLFHTSRDIDPVALDPISLQHTASNTLKNSANRLYPGDSTTLLRCF